MINQLPSNQPLLPVTFANGKHPYALGPVPEDQLTSLSGELDNGYPYTVQVPTIFTKLHHEPRFLEGCQFGYECYDDEAHSVIALCNLIRKEIYGELREPGAGFDEYVFIMGFVFGLLAVVAETEPVLARIGILHCCFLFSFVPPSCLENRRFNALNRMCFFHDMALKTYRGQVRELTSRGVDLQEAYQQALIPYVTPLPELSVRPLLRYRCTLGVK